MKFEGKRILVIGGSAGIGKKTALDLAKRGATVTIVGRNQDRVYKTLNELKMHNPNTTHEGLIYNLADITTVSLLINKIENIDGLVYSAGVQIIAPLTFISNADFEYIQFINSFAPFYIIRDLVKSKKINRGGSIVLVSSVSGVKIGAKGLISYSTSKGALTGMARSMALELAKQKIRVNTVLPGMIKDTLLNNSNNFSIEQLNEDKKKYPLGDYGTSEDVSNGIIFLLSDLSKYITGVELVIDGGLTLN